MNEQIIPMAMQQLQGSGAGQVNVLTEIIAAANKDRDIAKARIEALENALREIASQHLYEEMEEGWRDSADWQHAYEAIVGIARAALAPEQDK